MRLASMVLAAALSASVAGVCSAAESAAEELAELRALLGSGRLDAQALAEVETRARALLERVEATSGAESLAAAEVLDALFESLWHQEKAFHSDLRSVAERSLAIREKVLGPDHADVATRLARLADLLTVLGEDREARVVYERAVGLREKALGADHASVADILVELGAVRSRGGDAAGARPLLERALAIREQALGPDHVKVGEALNALGLTLLDLGEHAAARSALERALVIQERVSGPHDPALAMNLNNLASLLQEMRDLPAARAHFERSLAILENVVGPEHPLVGTLLSNLALLLHEMGDDQAARPLAERAIAIAEREHGPEDASLSPPLSTLARILSASGRPAEARRLQERALAINERSLGAMHPRLAGSLNGLAALLRDEGDFAGARALYERGLAIREHALGPRHPDVAVSLNNLARLHGATGDTALALDAALRSDTIVHEHARLTFRALSERQALRLVSDRAEGLDVALSLAGAGLGPQDRARAWDAGVRARAFVLDEIAARRRAASEATRVVRVAQDLATAAQRLAELTVRGPGDDPPEQHLRRLAEATEAKEKAERALGEQSASFREEQARSRLGLEDVTRALPPGTALVAYWRHVRHDVGRPGAPARASSKPEPAYLAFVARAGELRPEVVPLGSAKEIDARVAAWSREASAPTGEADVRAAGEALRRAVWDPLAPHLEGARRVLVVPDGSLHLVGLAALPVGETGWLVEDGPTLHYLSAERDVVPAGSSPRRGHGLLAVGGPDFDHRAAEATAAPPRTGEPDCASFESLRFSALPGAASETAEVAALWREHAARPGMPAAVQHVGGAAATEAAVKSSAAGRRALHVATHGFFLDGACAPSPPATRGLEAAPRPAQPRASRSVESPLLLSGLAFAGANRRAEAAPGEEDAILTAEEIVGLDLSGVEWAVLSACDTARGDVQAGEGVFGLRRAFQVAGAGTVVMSLWSVDDEATRTWMKSLYEARLVKGLDTAECVRESSLALLRERRAAGLDTHPFYWGGFVAAGDWR